MRTRNSWAVAVMREAARRSKVKRALRELRRRFPDAQSLEVTIDDDDNLARFVNGEDVEEAAAHDAAIAARHAAYHGR